MRINMTRNRLILEFTEFNLQRFNSDSVQASTHVNNPQLSIDAFDKHQDAIRQAMSRINDIMYNIKGTSSYSSLRSKLALEDQDIQSIKILRIVKNTVNYDIYLILTIKNEEYWGKISNILDANPKFTSELFKDYNLYQPKEWIIKINGLVIKTIKTWLKQEPGLYRLLNNEVICYSVETGKQLKISKGIEVEVIRSYENKIIIKYESDYFNITDDNFIYFNWWFEKIE
jgi:hypothetical protein